MKEDILKFRKLCDILIKERDYTVNKIIGEAKISWPTMNKLLKEPIDEIKIQASVLGLIQDFIKAHIQDIEYQGIKSDPIKEKEVEKKVEMMRKEIPPEYRKAEEKVHEEIKNTPSVNFQKLTIDIEINLIINGKRIAL